MCQTTTDPTVGRFKAYPKRHPSTSLRDEYQVGGEDLGEKPYWVISTFCQDDSEESDPCEEAQEDII